jgi:hypothetical protein
VVAALTATATCTAFRAVQEATGELVPARLLAERVGFLATLTQELAMAVVAARWNDGGTSARPRRGHARPEHLNHFM